MYGNYNNFGGYPQNLGNAGYQQPGGYYGNNNGMPDNLNQIRQPQQFQQPLVQPMQQPAQQPIQQPVIQPMQNNIQQGNNIDDRIWVANQTQAEAYFVVPNGFVRLWDSNQPTYYEKQCDSAGRPLPMEIYDYHRRGTPTQQQEAHTDQQAQISSETIKQYEERINELEERIKTLESSVKTNTSNSNKKEEKK